IPLPFSNPDEYVQKFETPRLRERIFHFTSGSISKLKAKVNEQSNTHDISSFQALSALVWRSMVRANRLPHDQVIYNYFLANIRERIDPPLPKYYFGNCIKALTITTTAGELLDNDLGWGASLLHQSVANLNDRLVRNFVNEWLQSPYCYHHEELHDYNSVTIEQSPRFDMFGNEFGLGKAVAVRSGYANKAIGVVYACPGHEGGGSVDFEICLPTDSMNALENDEEFMAFVSLQQ
ncbi:BAHD acyltransferase DCR, partial [Bienertia sinuspersici]